MELDFAELSMFSDSLDYLEKLAHPDTSTSELTMLSQHVWMLKKNQLSIYEWLVLFDKRIEMLEKENKDGSGYE